MAETKKTVFFANCMHGIAISKLVKKKDRKS